MNAKALQIRKKPHDKLSAERVASVDHYIALLDLQRRNLMLSLRELILCASPDITESVKFKIPFYDYFGMLCYLNSVKAGVALGFCNGAMLQSEKLSGSGKQIRHLIFKLDDKPDKQTLKLVFDAMALNEQLYSIKSQKYQRR